MSAPHSNHSDSNYPEDKVSHYPRDKSKKLKKMASKVKDGVRSRAGLKVHLENLKRTKGRSL